MWQFILFYHCLLFHIRNITQFIPNDYVKQQWTFLYMRFSGCREILSKGVTWLDWLFFLLSLVMVNFMCHLDWVMRCPDIWLNMILGVPVRVFWMKLTFELEDWVKQIALPRVVDLIQSGEGLTRTKPTDPPASKGDPFCLTALSWDIGSFLPLDSNWSIGFSWVLRLLAFGLELHYYLSWVSSFLTADRGTFKPL